MNKYKLYYCYDFINGELWESLATDDKLEAYDFMRSSEDPIVIYGYKIESINELMENKNETEIKTQ